MDLFLVDSYKQSKISATSVGIAGAALLGLYLFSQLFTIKED